MLQASSNVQYVAPGYLVYARDGLLLAQPFDATRAETTGAPFSIAENVAYFPESGLAAFSASNTGSIVFRSSPESAAVSRLVWFDRRGNRVGEIGEPAAYRNPRLSPDGARLAVETVDGSGNRDISILDVTRGVPRRFTFDTGRDASPVWSPDGKRIAWLGQTGTLVKASDGTGAVEQVHNEPWIPDDWQPDNGAILLHPGAPRRVLRIPVDGDRTPQVVLEGRASPPRLGFRPTASGWRSRTLTLAASKCFWRTTPSRPADGRSRPMAAFSRNGILLATNCSTLVSTDASWPCPWGSAPCRRSENHRSCFKRAPKRSPASPGTSTTSRRMAASSSMSRNRSTCR